MTFWQSPEWRARVDSIYELDSVKGEPALLPWWKEAWRLFRQQGNYDIILTMGVRASFAFAALCRLFGRKTCQVMTEVFIDSPRHQSMLWQLKTALYRRLARHAAGVITNSTMEISTNAARYTIPADRFHYVPLCTTITEPVYDPRPDGYLFCGGRTLRDYSTLKSVMLAGHLPWHVVTGAGDLTGTDFPDRIIIHREISRERYLELLRGARVVVLPLLRTERATGQVVILEAMSYGKPVITSRTPGAVDIIRDQENGFLVDPGDAAAIQNILDRLVIDPEMCARIGRQAFMDVQTLFTVKTHAELRLKAVLSIWNEYSGHQP